MPNLVQILIQAKNESDRAFSGLDKNVNKSSKLLAGLRKAAIAGGIGVATGLVLATKAAITFEQKFAEVQTLLPDLELTAIDDLKSGILDVSKQFGIASGEAVPALYQAISAGIPPNNVMEFLGVAAQASIGGVTSLETAVDGITSVVNAYGEGVIEAQQASDLMFTAVRLGKTTFDELAGSLFNVIPTAASLGIGFDEVAAAMAVMTAQGVPTRVATTNLRQAFVEASKTGSELDKAIRDMAGKGFAQLTKEGKTAFSVFDQLRESMPEQEFRDLFGSVEALNAVLLITGPQADGMRNALEEMKASTGASAAAFDVIADTAAFKVGKAFNALKVTFIEVGAQILPKLVAFVEGSVVPAFQKLAAWFEQNRPAIMAAISAIRERVEDLAEGVKAFVEGVILPIFRSLATWFADNKPAIMAVLDAISGAVMAFADTVRQFVVDVILPVLGRLIDWFRKNGPAIMDALGTVASAIRPFAAAFLSGLGVVRNALVVLGKAFLVAGKIIMPILGRLVKFIVSNKPVMVAAIAALGVAILLVMGPGAVVVAAIIGFIALLGFLRDNWRIVWDAIKTKFNDVTSTVADVFRSKFAWLLPGGALRTALTSIKERWDTIWGAIGDGMGPIMGAITTVVKGGVDAIIDFINTMIRAWNRLEFKVPSFDVGPVKFGGFSVSLPDITPIPKLAHGIRSFRGGLALVGEMGPELVRLPRGADVLPNMPEITRLATSGPLRDGSQARAGDINVTIIVQGDVNGEMDFDRLVRRSITEAELLGASG